MANTSTQVKDLLEETRLIFNDIKTNYGEFLSSLKYENLADKKKTKVIRRKMEEMPGGAEGWESIMNKQFSFEDELINQNGGFTSFVNLIGNIKRLEEINYQLALRFFLEEKSTAGQEQLQSVVGML
jgi:hypothetical protein